MYITNFRHFIDDQGEIPTNINVEARELANFLALLIDDASSGDYDSEPTIRCIEKGCSGLIVPMLVEESAEIYWVCIGCKTNGIITDWQETKWDNRK